MKKVICVAVLLVAMGLSASAATLTPCGERGSETVAGLQTKGGCISGDKIFTGFSDILPADGSLPIPGNWEVNITEPFTDEHVVDFIQCTVGCLPLTDPAIGTPTVWGIQYSITVDTANYPNQWISKIGVSQNATVGEGGSAMIQKYAYDANGNLLTPAGQWPLTSTGSFVFGTLSPKVQYVLVKEFITLDKATVTSFSDKFVQSTIPEPGTYAMMGLGLAALGLIARRKKA
jgi:hypothetical protein